MAPATGRKAPKQLDERISFQSTQIEKVAAMASMTPDKLKSMFEDLGKPTLRGVRRCPKCGTLNGTRGINCKNKTCDIVFKERDKKKGHSADSVKIITGSNVQVFSVRLRDRGPDYRAFVQLPLVQDLHGNPAENVDPVVLESAARCYVDTCCRSLVGIQQTTACSHIKAAVACADEAVPLTLKNSVLNSLKVNSEMKQAIWLLATETSGPLVQRVTKNMMVVKCHPTSKHPLGFLHFAFFETIRNRSHPEHKFHCSCKSSRTKLGLGKEEAPKRCVHFYACICAFASDEKLAQEFSFYIALDSISICPDGSEDDSFVTLLPLEHVEVAAGDATIAETDPNSVEVIIDEESLLAESEPTKAKRERTEELILGTDTIDNDFAASAQASSALLTLQNGDPSVLQTSGSITMTTVVSTTPKKIVAPKPVQQKVTTVPKKTVDENEVQLTFHEWLASVTERINQTMHYQFDGNPDPLVFHTSQKFFDCMQQRISAGSRKKRLPNSTTGFLRRDALPLGTFTKYTWCITSIFHVKQIFDTPLMSLEITRSFVQNRDGTYDLYEAPKLTAGAEVSAGKMPIRPSELKTYLKVGVMSPVQKEPTAFIIEWIPDILPASHIGELRIKFEYGHQRNGQMEQRSAPPAGDVDMQTVHIQPIQPQV